MNKINMPILYEQKKDCYACCPVKAIQMKSDNEGFQYPIIDEKKCIRCLKCIKVCPLKT